MSSSTNSNTYDRNRGIWRSLRTQMTALPPPDADFTGKCMIVIGANSGIGLEAARAFVRLNAATVILGCRSVEKGELARRDIEESMAAARSLSQDGYRDSSNLGKRGEDQSGVVQVWPIDLSSFSSVRTFCHRATSELPHLDVLIQNAGLYTTKHELFEGYERQTTVHIISTYLIALLLLPKLRQTAEGYYRYPEAPHMCIVGSNAHVYETQRFDLEGSSVNDGRHPVFEALRGDVMMAQRHNTTKLLSVLMMRELARRMKVSAKPRVVLNMPEPGFCQTGLRKPEGEGKSSLLLGVSQRLIARTAEMGSRTYVHAAAAGWDSHGKYLEDCEISAPSEFVDSTEGEQLQKEVWDELLDILESIEPGISENI